MKESSSIRKLMEKELEKEERGAFVTTESYRPENDTLKLSNLWKFIWQSVPPSLIK
jgi:hypothetical protein